MGVERIGSGNPLLPLTSALSLPKRRVFPSNGSTCADAVVLGQFGRVIARKAKGNGGGAFIE